MARKGFFLLHRRYIRRLGVVSEMYEMTFCIRRYVCSYRNVPLDFFTTPTFDSSPVVSNIYMNQSMNMI